MKGEYIPPIDKNMGVYTQKIIHEKMWMTAQSMNNKEPTCLSLW